MHRPTYALFFFYLFVFCPAFSQDHPKASPRTNAEHDTPVAAGYIVGKISINGNKVTRNYVILRELSFRTGDTLTLDELVKAFHAAHDRLVNTHLFNEVVIYLQHFNGYTADVGIDVRERWYIFPLPYVKPVDRNLAAWAQKDYSLRRLNYGGKFADYNFTGRGDNLTVWLITGYERELQLYYNLRNADRSQRHGFGFGLNYAELSELDALTLNNTQQFINSDTIAYAGKFLGKTLAFSARYFYRPRLKVRHTVNINLVSTSIDSAVTVRDTHYFNNGVRKLIYPEWVYTYNYTDVDYVSYPLNGVIFETALTRRGVDRDMNLWQVSTRLTRSWPLAYKLWFGIQNINVLKWPLSQPFYNQGLLGYADLYLRGLDRYVVDGTAGGVLRNTLFRELFNRNLPLRHNSSHDHLPLRIYATIFTDYGYAYNQDFKGNSLVNRMLYTAGFGVDLVTFYDLSFKLDYSFNQLGQNGLFLHIRNDF
jgi:outer membrane protein assembly factor BamA